MAALTEQRNQHFVGQVADEQIDNTGEQEQCQPRRASEGYTHLATENTKDNVSDVWVVLSEMLGPQRAGVGEYYRDGNLCRALRLPR